MEPIHTQIDLTSKGFKTPSNNKSIKKELEESTGIFTTTQNYIERDQFEESRQEIMNNKTLSGMKKRSRSHKRAPKEHIPKPDNTRNMNNRQVNTYKRPRRIKRERSPNVTSIAMDNQLKMALKLLGNKAHYRSPQKQKLEKRESIPKNYKAGSQGIAKRKRSCPGVDRIQRDNKIRDKKGSVERVQSSNNISTLQHFSKNQNKAKFAKKRSLEPKLRHQTEKFPNSTKAQLLKRHNFLMYDNPLVDAKRKNMNKKFDNYTRDQQEPENFEVRSKGGKYTYIDLEDSDQDDGAPLKATKSRKVNEINKTELKGRMNIFKNPSLKVISQKESPEEKVKINTLFSNFQANANTEDTNRFMNNRYRPTDLESGINDCSIRLSMT
eukprot:CAMPEP_0197019304 /NCGR_PEP_ID=MMETSP1380-20130617/80617_1 /TAXON_ID=5936 /ORGANISM="Euplotes crassus, Strain CT5" /LENGTH=380 /DNA_ID=CAMNT_0042446689 /DNA_START=379 /DNA_END=1517 /DNA_ORIENTATION=-